MHRLLIPALAILASCYRPRAEGACVVRCDPQAAPQCPGALTCGSDGLCFDDIECSLIDSGVVDVPPRDEPVITNDCVSTLLLGNVCPMTFAPAFTLPATILTDTTVCTEVLGTPPSEVCLIAADSIRVVGLVRVTGVRPLALFGRTSIFIDAAGSIDLARGGAGQTLGCMTNAGRSQATVGEAAGGGAGGTFAAMGGAGGVPSGFPGVFAKPRTPIETLRGGCLGGFGGNNVNAAGGGRGGLPGGAIQLMSPMAVEIHGTIDAFGEGGLGGTGASNAAGGGGGGSGGLIAIDARTIIIGPTAVLRAHGGGGGGGAAGTVMAMKGADAVADDGSGAAGGMRTGNNSGSGGAGSSNASPTGTKGDDTLTNGAGAGGGGGGAGAIILRAADPLGVDPLAKIHPPPGPVP